MKHWFIALFSVSLIGCASTHHEIMVEATPQEVWSVLVDAESYSEWNPVIIEPEGKFKEGEEIVFQFRESTGKQYEVKAKVVKVTPEKLLNQYGGVWGVLTYDHKYILESVKKGTKVTIHEDYKGAYVPFWDHSNMDSSYAKLNESLKKRVLFLKNKAQK